MPYDPNFPRDNEPALKAQFREHWQILVPASKMPDPASSPDSFLKSTPDGSGWQLVSSVSGSASVNITLHIQSASFTLDSSWQEYASGAVEGIDRHVVLIDGGTAAVDVTLPADAPKGARYFVMVDAGRTGTVRFLPATGASFDDGSTDLTLETYPATRICRLTVVQNADGASAVWAVEADTVPEGNVYTAPAGRKLHVETLWPGYAFSGDLTWDEAAHGGFTMVFNGTTAATLTIPSSAAVDGRSIPVVNIGSATLTIAGPSGTASVVAGEAALVRVLGSTFYLWPAGPWQVI